MARSIALVVAGIAIAVLVVVGVMDGFAPGYWFGQLLPMLVIVAAGLALLLWTAHRRRGLDDDHVPLDPTGPPPSARTTPESHEES